MIIYYAMTKFHLIFSIVHKRRTYGDQEAVLFVYSGLQGIGEERERIREAGFFREIYPVPEIELKSDWTPLNDKSGETEIRENVQRLVRSVETWLPVQISGRDTIYLANDHWALGLYCIWKNIPYHYYEDGVGMLSKPEYSRELVYKMNRTHAIVASYMGAFGQNALAVEKIGDLENQTEGFADEKAVHFSLKDELRQLPGEDTERLLAIFDAPKLSEQEGVTLLLTEHFVNMRRLTIEGQRELYALLVDFFCESPHLCVKPHPNDFQISYRQIFPEAEMISRFFPSELLPFCFDRKLNLALAACSTSVYGLRDASERILRFDIDIEDHYAYILRYYVCGLILKALGAKRVMAVHAYRDLLEAFFDGEMEEGAYPAGAGGSGKGEADPDRSGTRESSLDENGGGESDLDEDNVDESSAVSGDGNETGARRIYVVDDRHQATESGIFPLGEWDTAIFINSSDRFHMFAELDFVVDERQWRTVAIRKELDEGSLLQNEWPETVWIYSRDPGTLKIIEVIKEEKRLKHVGVTLDVDCITDSQEMKIRILEGNLRASLARIEKYREEEREHLETIRNLEEQLRQQDQETVDLLAKALEERRRK